MKIDKQSMAAGLVIGVVIGGAVIGVMDARRPVPLFSSADGGTFGPQGMGVCDNIAGVALRTTEPGSAARAKIVNQWEMCVRHQQGM